MKGPRGVDSCSDTGASGQREIALTLAVACVPKPTPPLTAVLHLLNLPSKASAINRVRRSRMVLWHHRMLWSGGLRVGTTGSTCFTKLIKIIMFKISTCVELSRCERMAIDLCGFVSW